MTLLAPRLPGIGHHILKIRLGLTVIDSLDFSHLLPALSPILMVSQTRLNLDAR